MIVGNGQGQFQTNANIPDGSNDVVITGAIIQKLRVHGQGHMSFKKFMEQKALNLLPTV